MRLTKRKALEICKDLWTWMRDEQKCDSDDKIDWPRWKYNGGDISEMYGSCPCCEYEKYAIRKQLKKGCDASCILSGYAWSKNCSESFSPYIVFESGMGTPKDSQKIIDACDKALEDL